MPENRKILQLKARLEEILCDINAYRQGWISYDAKQVEALQMERLSILQQIAKEASNATTIR